MNPTSHKQARWQVRALLTLPKVIKAARHQRAETKIRSISRSQAAAEVMWRHHQVGIWRWQLHHVHWYLRDYLRDRSRETRYQHYLAVRRLIVALDRTSWIPSLAEYAQRGGTRQLLDHQSATNQSK